MARDIKLLSRKEATRASRKVFLIVCEGSKTEPAYFSSFRLPKHVVDIEGCGVNTGTVVEEAERFSRAKGYDEVWCVFDRDSFPRQRVNAAIKKAEQLGFKVAFSNESFELWYLLHFAYMDVAMNRHQYCEKLTELLGEPYQKNSGQMYARLHGQQSNAISNAKRLEREIQNPSWANRVPYTSVYKLVLRLNSYSKKYGQF